MDSESASLQTAGVTAWSAIREELDASLSGELRGWQDGKRLEGKTLLTQGTGGVSCFAIQVCNIPTTNLFCFINGGRSHLRSAQQ